MMFDVLVSLRCRLEGAISGVLIDRHSRFNRRRLITGTKGLIGHRAYPLRIKQSRLCGSVSVGYGTWILRCDINVGVNGRITIGRFTSINGTEISAGESLVHIGSFCSIANGTKIITSGHNMSRPSTYYIFKHISKEHNYGEVVSRGDIFIDSDVWIGVNSVILGGVRIGRGAVIGAGSVVTGDVAPYSIVGGNPAKLIRMRFPEDVIETINRSGWWNWDIDKIKESREFFQSEYRADRN